MKTIKVECLRYSKFMDSRPHYDTFEVPFHNNISILEILEYITENLDPTLAYPMHSLCRQGICGKCTIRVNNKPILPCIETPRETHIIIEPLKKESIVKDLVSSR
jgi:succinate dehydrogenase/fumarate reductase-like Fe-S protein